MNNSFLTDLISTKTRKPLWEIFNYCISNFTRGKFVPNEFKFIPGKIFMSTKNSALSAIALYYIIIFGGRYMLESRQPLKLNMFFQLHNILLSVFSLIVLLLLLEQLTPIIYERGLFYAICDSGSWTQPIVTLYYINYLIKYFEFIDTVFLVLKHKNLTFLHTYHHGATALLCYTELVGYTTISWVPITLNLGVHVLMYWYYFLAARGIKVPWKRWITRFQILQFVIDLIFIYFATYQKLVHVSKIDLPYCGDCFGSLTSNISGCAILSSYLFLFIAFYIEAYKKKRDSKRTTEDKKNI